MTDRRSVFSLDGRWRRPERARCRGGFGSEPRELASQFAATLSAHNIDAFAALFAEDYINHQQSAAAPPPAAGVTPKQGWSRFSPHV